MRLLEALVSSPRGSESRYTVDDYLNWLMFNGVPHLAGLSQTLKGDREEIHTNFEGYVQGAFQRSGPVYAAESARVSVFSEARFMFRRLRDGRPGDLFGTRELGLLERPWPGGTTGDLLSRVLLHADLAGNSFTVRRGSRLKQLRPDWVTIVMGINGRASPDADPVSDLDGEVIGYLYHPGGRFAHADPIPLRADEVAHFAPSPDPLASYRGMSWLTPVLREISADSAATSHKLKFFENGATPNMVAKLDISDPEKFQQWIDVFESNHVGASNAYRTLYLGAGADVSVVGSDLRQLDFKATQGAGETRIAAAAGVPPVVLGLSEGMQGSALNAGNYAQARRNFADRTLHPLWRNMAGSFANIVDVPADAELWYDHRDIPFLREDRKDAAEILQINAAAVNALVTNGFTPESAIRAVQSEDLSLLEHTGLVSVQLLPPNPNRSVETNND